MLLNVVAYWIELDNYYNYRSLTSVLESAVGNDVTNIWSTISIERLLKIISKFKILLLECFRLLIDITRVGHIAILMHTSTSFEHYISGNCSDKTFNRSMLKQREPLSMLKQRPKRKRRIQLLPKETLCKAVIEFPLNWTLISTSKHVLNWTLFMFDVLLT